jgi:hypothetical protein
MKRLVLIVAGFIALGMPFATSASAATIAQGFPNRCHRPRRHVR